MTRIFSRLSYAVGAAMLLIALMLTMTSRAQALNNSSLLLSDPRTSQTTDYTFASSNFTTATSLQCITIELNTQADGGGSVPTGVDTTSFTLDSSTLITAGSWTEDTGVNGVLEITSAGENPASNGNIIFGNIDNGSTEGATYYALFNTYSDACSTVVDSTVVAFVYTNGELVQLTIDPTLTFSVNDVAAGEFVNTVETTVGSTATGINFGNTVDQANNGVSAHDIEVGTNAPGGYTVSIRHTEQLTNAASDTIANHSGTNGTPTAFPGVGTEAWGYTTEDSTLETGTADRFTNGGPFWAGFTTGNEIVVDNSGTFSGTETTRIGHQVGVAATTPAGTYQTTIIYTVASTY